MNYFPPRGLPYLQTHLARQNRIARKRTQAATSHKMRTNIRLDNMRCLPTSRVDTYSYMAPLHHSVIVMMITMIMIISIYSQLRRYNFPKTVAIQMIRYNRHKQTTYRENMVNHPENRLSHTDLTRFRFFWL